MATIPLVQYGDAPRDVQDVFDEIKRTRNLEDVNNFWKALANQPETLKRTWGLVRDVMRPGALDELTKEMIYAAVSITNNCDYCIHSHTAAAFNKGMTEAQYQELLAVVSTAHLTQRTRERIQSPCGRALQARLIGPCVAEALMRACCSTGRTWAAERHGFSPTAQIRPRCVVRVDRRRRGSPLLL